MTRIGGVPRPRPGDAYLSRPRDPTAPRQCLRPRSASFRSSFGPYVLPFDAMAHPGFLPDRARADRAAVAESETDGSAQSRRPPRRDGIGSPRLGARLESPAHSPGPEGKGVIHVHPGFPGRRPLLAAVDAFGEEGVGLRVADLAFDHRGFEEALRLGVERTVARRVGRSLPRDVRRMSSTGSAARASVIARRMRITPGPGWSTSWKPCPSCARTAPCRSVTSRSRSSRGTGSSDLRPLRHSVTGSSSTLWYAGQSAFGLRYTSRTSSGPPSRRSE